MLGRAAARLFWKCAEGLRDVFVECFSPRHRPNPSNPSNPSARQDFVEQLQFLMRSLADHAAAAADATGDFMAAQCVARRLPQRPPAAPVPLPPAKKLVVRWADPTAVRVVLESRPGQEAEIQIYHTMENDAASHMQPELEPGVEMAYSFVCFFCSYN